MSIVMLGFMWSMCKGAGTKLAVVLIAGLFALSLLALNRRQALIDDIRFMRAMVPHHSIAVNNARKAGLSDPRVRRLADRIIDSQVRETAEMKLLIDEISRNGKRGSSAIPARSAELTRRWNGRPRTP